MEHYAFTAIANNIIASYVSIAHYSSKVTHYSSKVTHYSSKVTHYSSKVTQYCKTLA